MPTYSQNGQDGFVLSRFDKPGFFVEAGAMNGILFSNTLLLEEHDWDGICVEPYEPEFMELAHNRKCKVDRRALAAETDGQRLLTSCIVKQMQHPLRGFSSTLPHKPQTVLSGKIVTTVTLHDLLAQHNAPREIEYLSLDIEGHELEVLKAFDFSYRFSVITVETLPETPNGRQRRKQLRELLRMHGYRLFGRLGHDDIFVHRDAAATLKGNT